MRTNHRFPILTLLLALACVLPAAAETRTLSGEYDWSDGGSGELSAEFEPLDGESWEVTFRFRFSGKKNRWNGTAEGRFEEGAEISGTATWKKRQWVWRAVYEDGVLRGTHTEIQSGGKRYETGSFELR